MTTLLSFIFFFISLNGYSFQLPTLQEIPNELTCTFKKTKNPILENGIIHIKNIRTAVSFVGLDATSDTPAEISWFTTVIGASNMCDNDYSMAFATDDLVSLQRGEIKQVVGFFKYTNAEEVCQGFGCRIRPTINISCQKSH